MKKRVWFSSFACLSLVPLVLLVLLGARGRGHEPADGLEINVFTLNALDHRLNIYDLRQDKPGLSRQLDENYREYLGDLFFNGEDLLVLENDRYTGHFLLLGEDKKPDTEFAMFHSLRIYKRTFQLRQFPFLDRYLPYPAIEPNSFFGAVREPRTGAKMSLGHAYLLRLYHRTTVGDERIFLLKVIDVTPGVKVSVLWRELENLREP